MKKLLAVLLAACMALSLVACGGSTSAQPTSGSAASGSGQAAAASGQVYFLNFKPEQDEAYRQIAEEYTALTGVPVKVVTAASGTYEQQLRSEIAKSDAPTIFQVNGPVGYANWKDYTADLSGTELYSHLSDPTLAITDGQGVYGIPFAIEGYGIIVNRAIMDRYFQTDNPAVAALTDINGFATLEAVVEDMQAKKDELGIEGVFASTSLAPGEDWRWQTHLMNLPMYYEWHNENLDLSDPAATETIQFTYNPEYQQIFDLYLNNSTVDRKLTGAKSVNDSMAEFALGQAAMVQNGNWAYSQIAGVDGNVVAEEDVIFIPIYTGMDGEATQGLCIGTENYFCINKNASPEDQQASLDFLTWLYTSDAGKQHVTQDLGFIAPFDTFTENDKPADPLGKQVMEWAARTDVTNIPWNFTLFPSQAFKDDFGADLLQYAQGNMAWDAVVQDTIARWAEEKQAAAA